MPASISFWAPTIYALPSPRARRAALPPTDTAAEIALVARSSRSAQGAVEPITELSRVRATRSAAGGGNVATASCIAAAPRQR